VEFLVHELHERLGDLSLRVFDLIDNHVVIPFVEKTSPGLAKVGGISSFPSLK